MSGVFILGKIILDNFLHRVLIVHIPFYVVFCIHFVEENFQFFKGSQLTTLIKSKNSLYKKFLLWLDNKRYINMLFFYYMYGESKNKKKDMLYLDDNLY